MVYHIEPATALKLIVQARRFAAGRAAVKRRLKAYRRDFLEREGSRRTELWPELEDRYREGAPDLRHLVRGADGEVLWGRRDIAIVLDRDESTVMRTLRGIESDADFSRRLADLSADGAYREGVFDLILDYYEMSYIRRFTRPRTGSVQSGPLLDYWNWLLANPDADEDEALELLALTPQKGGSPAPSDDAPVPEPCPGGAPRESADEPDFSRQERRSCFQALCDISLRTCSIRVGTLFIVLFALYHEAAQVWPAIVPVVPFVCLAAVLLSLWMLRTDRWPGFDPASLGAGAVLFLILWGAGAAFGLRAQPPQARGPAWHAGAGALGAGALVCLSFVAAGVFLTARDRRRDDWPLRVEASAVEKTAPAAVMPEGERMFPEKFGGREWLSFAWCPEPSEPPSVLRVDFSAVRSALESGEIARAWWGVNATPTTPLPAQKDALEVSSRQSDMEAALKLVAGERYDDDEFHYLSLLFELPDGSRVGPARFPVTARRADVMSAPQIARADWGARDELLRLEDNGVVVRLLRGAGDDAVNMTIENANPAPIAHAIFSLESPLRGEEGEPRVSLYRELDDVPAGAVLAMTDVFSAEAIVHRHVDGGSFSEWLKSAGLKLFVSSPRFGDSPAFAAPGLTGKVVLRETLCPGNDRVLLEILNDTGRRVDGFKSCLEARGADGNLLARAAQTRGDPHCEPLYRGSKTYMTYIFRDAEPLPPDVRFVLKFFSIAAEPPLILGGAG